MKFKDFKADMLNAEATGKLLIPKHDPNQLGIFSYQDYRTVVAHEAINVLKTFIESDQYEVVQYYNKNYPNSPYYWTVTPSPESKLTVAGSGITANTVVVNTADTFVLVSGNTEGLHMFAEEKKNIKQKFKSGELYNKTVIKPFSNTRLKNQIKILKRKKK